MNLFDTSVVHYLIKRSQYSPSFTSFMMLLVDNALLRWRCCYISALVPVVQKK